MPQRRKKKLFTLKTIGKWVEIKLKKKRTTLIRSKKKYDKLKSFGGEISTGCRVTKNICTHIRKCVYPSQNEPECDKSHI